MRLDKNKVEQTFNKYWEKSKKMKPWDYLSQIIFDRLSLEVGNFKHKKVLEAGSGSGRISKMISKHGADVTLLDISPQALEISKRVFNQANLKGKFKQGSIFDIPFKDNSFDVVWNAGVLEHFEWKDQVKALSEMKRVCKPQGLVITTHPYAGSYLYRAGKKALQILGKWDYGNLVPIKTLKSLAREVGLEVRKEFPEAFVIQLTEAPRRFVPFIGKYISDTLGLFCIRFRGKIISNIFRPIDMFLAKYLGGYLITTVMVKSTKN